MKKIGSVLETACKILGTVFGITFVLYMTLIYFVSTYFGLRDSPAFESRKVSVLWQREGTYTYAVCDSENVYMYDAEDSLDIGETLTLTCFAYGNAINKSVSDVEVVAEGVWGFCDAIGLISAAAILLLVAACVVPVFFIGREHARQSSKT